jgi:uncharacterized protein (DUF1684 family)
MKTNISSVWLAIVTMALAVYATTWADAPAADSSAMYEQQVLEWREARHQRLSSENGWLTLVGLEWLSEGENRIGGDAAGAISIPGSEMAWGTLTVDGDSLLFVPAPGAVLHVDGLEADGETALIADSQGEPTVVSSGSISFYVIDRGSYALRIKDSRARVLQEFTGIDNYPIQPEWRVEGRFIPPEEGQTIEIANVLGQVIPTPVFGYVEFERDGESYRLLGLGGEDSEAPWFLFTDRTSGRETYGAGRYLYSDGLPVEGRLVVDFNKAYNPPCAFSDYATCPLPPQENRMGLAVTAGEKKFGDH